MYKKYIILSFLVLVFSACDNKKKTTVDKVVLEKITNIELPEFNSDSAYDFVRRQVEFGPRVPGTKAHSKCADYLFMKLNEYADTAMFQEFKSRIYTGEFFDSKNIIASFCPEKTKRILLAAHWDSRYVADHDPNLENRKEHVDGANDGASGVGVLLEIARLLSENKPNVGVDIILFDIEDQGPPEGVQTNSDGEEWGLGAQYWAKNPHQFNYTAYYGILLDMVGGYNAKFYEEQFSVMYASSIVDLVWNEAISMGFGEYFYKEKGIYVNDDHYYINKYANIPMINIIEQNPDTPDKPFYKYWHTTHDNMEGISRQTLNIVGSVVTKVIFNEN